MGFSKTTEGAARVAIEFSDPLIEGDRRVLVMRSRMNAEAEAARERYVGLPSEERDAAFQQFLAESVSALLVEEPEGFDDFPQANLPVVPPEPLELSMRAKNYFNDPAMKSYLEYVWGVYRRATEPEVLFRILPIGGAGSDAARPGTVGA